MCRVTRELDNAPLASLTAMLSAHHAGLARTCTLRPTAARSVRFDSTYTRWEMTTPSVSPIEKASRSSAVRRVKSSPRRLPCESSSSPAPPTPRAHRRAGLPPPSSRLCMDRGQGGDPWLEVACAHTRCDQGHACGWHA